MIVCDICWRGAVRHRSPDLADLADRRSPVLEGPPETVPSSANGPDLGSLTTSELVQPLRHKPRDSVALVCSLSVQWFKTCQSSGNLKGGLIPSHHESTCV